MEDITLTKPLFDYNETTLTTYGEKVLGLFENEVVDFVYTRALELPVLRKFTSLCKYSELVSKYPHIPKLDKEDVILIDLRSPPVRSSYELYVEHKLPLTYLYDNLDIFREILADQELIDKIKTTIKLCDDASKLSLVTKRANSRSIVEYLGYVKKEYKDVVETLNNNVVTYDDKYYFHPCHPEIIALKGLIEELKIKDNSILITPHGYPLFKLFYNKKYSKINVENTLQSLVKYEFHNLNSYTDNNSPYIFRLGEGVLKGMLEYNKSDLKFVLDEFVGKWIHELDMTNCIISGGSLCSVVSLLHKIRGVGGNNRKTLIEYHRALYPNVYTVLRDDEGIESFKQSFYDCGKEFSEIAEVNYETRTLRIRFDDKDYMFDIVPASDVDMPVLVKSEEELYDIANKHLNVVKKFYPNVLMEEVTENRETKMFRIISDKIEDYINGFKNIEMYMSTKQKCITYHLGPVRGWLEIDESLRLPSDNKSSSVSIYVTASCALSHISGHMREYHVFKGKKTKCINTLKKYQQRGFIFSGYGMVEDGMDAGRVPHIYMEGNFNLLLLFNDPNKGMYKENEVPYIPMKYYRRSCDDQYKGDSSNYKLYKKADRAFRRPEGRVMRGPHMYAVGYNPHGPNMVRRRDRDSDSDSSSDSD